MRDVRLRWLHPRRLLPVLCERHPQPSRGDGTPGAGRLPSGLGVLPPGMERTTLDTDASGPASAATRTSSTKADHT